MIRYCQLSIYKPPFLILVIKFEIACFENTTNMFAYRFINFGLLLTNINKLKCTMTSRKLIPRNTECLCLKCSYIFLGFH